MIRFAALPLALPLALAVLTAPPLLAQVVLAPADQAAAFRAAGFKRVGGQWQGCGDPGTASYTPGAIESVADLNGDGRPEAVVTEGSVYCFGNTGQGFVIASKQADGSWKRITDGPGMVTVLATPAKVLAATGGWPDLEIGGSGFCFPVERWNGREYVLHRHQYEGKACKG